MKDDFLVLSTSLNPESNSRKMAKTARDIFELGPGANFIDLQEYPLPLCDGASSYSHPNLPFLSESISKAKCIIMAVPIYNYDVNAAAKNLIELTGRAWSGKTVGFLCAAGGRASYMSIMSLANSLMLDFRCLIIPRFVYAEGSCFSAEALSNPDLQKRIAELTEEAMRLNQSFQPVV
ncbi:MAG: NAD(P)H-dependent oxidoreductase [Candidatus Obscuribacterales bacterium]|nr:NAD(P)H-dependent oxidoreductase [Candidatus Obscuribacterales bacterium]